MSRFTFVHAADLHLGSPLAGLAVKDEDIARRFAEAGRRAFEELVRQTIALDAAFLVIAGDIYDGDWPDATIGLFFARELAKLDRAGIPVALIRGNHDAESIITRTISLPDTVVQFPTNKAATHRLEPLRVALHGRGFPRRAVPDDFARSYPEPLPGWLNIGILHTSCAGHASHETYAPCAPADLAARGYDYWALGHVHDYTEVWPDPPIVFPGNLQGRSIRETGPKGAVVVDVVDGRIVGTRRLIVDQARWAKVDVDLSGFHDERDVVAAVQDEMRASIGAAEGRLVAIRARLFGATALHERLTGERERLAAEIQAAAHRLHEDVWLERLVLATRRPTALAAPAEGAALDPVSMLAPVMADAAFRAKATATLADFEARLPASVRAEEAGLADEFETLLAEAEALVVARLTTGR